MVGSYSCVHCERTRRSVMLDLPQPPSPQIVIVIRWGSGKDILKFGSVWCSVLNGEWGCNPVGWDKLKRDQRWFRWCPP